MKVTESLHLTYKMTGSIWQLPAEAIARREGHHDISEFLLYHERKPAP